MDLPRPRQAHSSLSSDRLDDCQQFSNRVNGLPCHLDEMCMTRRMRSDMMGVDMTDESSNDGQESILRQADRIVDIRCRAELTVHYCRWWSGYRSGFPRVAVIGRGRMRVVRTAIDTTLQPSIPKRLDGDR